MSDFRSIRLFLIRHAQARNAAGTSYDDASLSALGRVQGGAAAGAIAARRPDALFTSPAPRARQTAELIAEAAGLPVTVDERLREFVFGSVADPGLTLEQLRARRDDLLVWHPDRRLAADGETLREFALRITAALDGIVARHVAESVAVVAHARNHRRRDQLGDGARPRGPVDARLPDLQCQHHRADPLAARARRRRRAALHRIRESRIAGPPAARGPQRQLK